MPYYRQVGDVPRKRHSYVRVDGGLPVRGADGSRGLRLRSRRCSITDDRPARSSRSKRSTEPEQPACADVPLTPRHLRTDCTRTAVATRYATARVLFANDDVRIAWFAATDDRAISTATRSATSSCTCSRVRASLESSFGALTVGPGDYVVVPPSDDASVARRRRRTAHGSRARSRDNTSASRASTSPIAASSAKARRSRERDLRGPGEPLVCDGDDVPVLVRNRSGLSRLVHANHPFDVVGWDGCVWPFAFSIHDFEPIVGARHQPPPVHQTFEGSGFVVCSFVPRPFDFGDGAVKVPYHHANVDSDEVLFYSAGDFMSRAGQRHRRRFDLVPPGGIRARPAARERRSVTRTRRAPKKSR